MDDRRYLLPRDAAQNLLQNLIGEPICYGLKSADMEFFDIGIGQCDIIQISDNKTQFLSSYAIHASCCIKISDRENAAKPITYSGESLCEAFHNEMKQLIGLRIKRIALSGKNDLWVDVGKYWIVFVTYEDEKESWRLLAPRGNDQDLVVTHDAISMGG